MRAEQKNASNEGGRVTRVRRAVPIIVSTALLFAASGCITQRSFRLPDPATVALAPSSTEPVTDVRWTVGQIYVDAGSTGPARSATDWQRARLQLEEHLGRVLLEGGLPGTHVAHHADADVILDLTVRISEERTINGWYSAALVTQAAVTLGSLVAAGATSDPNGLDSGVVLAGSGIGLAVIGGSTLLPGNDFIGKFESVLTVRRAEDGVSIAERRFGTTWTDRFNEWGQQEKLERASSASAVELDKAVLATIAESLKNVPASARRPGPTDAAPSAGPEGGDVPFARVQLLPQVLR